ncbi:multicomponent Na+:H+ antiporter subunit D [Caldicoprobacter guelmensis]|uniref:complex I subunit 5 family protein n=1 Tax=Caldicoprobacter guelmensis TaxID=1170224 RepID=UPI001958DA5B|nr:proton-conducting transporter membrane subunit [Caldicoprobacter guelmensis]MBM7581874.1 multicomponent Na+:H+ antiporter subunit D [Caldicoprobacter guelmensis]
MVPLYVLILSPIIFGALLFIISGKYSRYAALVFQCLLVLAAIYNFIRLKGSDSLIYMEYLGGWSSTVGISLKLDLIAAVLVILTTVLFMAMLTFDIKSTYVNRLFLMLFLILEGLIIGIFVSHDFFNVFVLYEVSTVVVSILIMFQKAKQSIYDGMIYLLTNLVAMVFFLFGTAILYRMLGVLDFALVQERMYLLQDLSSLILPYAFIITALNLKTALMPLFSWLPRAHATPSAPSIISGILSGLFVKNGVYLFLRIKNIFDPFIDVTDLFLLLGFLTAVVGFVLAISQKDIKLILAYHTVSQIGLIVMGLNMNNEQAFWGAVYHIINHAVFKSVLFLTAGIISKEYGTRNIYEIRGALKSMPAVSVAAILAVLGITGAPFFNGSMSKYWIAYGAKDSILEMGIIIINLGTIISFVKYSKIFFGQSNKTSIDVLMVQKVTVVSMGLMCLAGGIFAKQFIGFLFNQYLLVEPISYMEKIGVFMLSLLIGSFIYFRVIEKYKLLNKVKSFELSFNDICLMIFLFFSFVFLYLKIKA